MLQTSNLGVLLSCSFHFCHSQRVDQVTRPGPAKGLFNWRWTVAPRFPVRHGTQRDLRTYTFAQRLSSSFAMTLQVYSSLTSSCHSWISRKSREFRISQWTTALVCVSSGSSVTRCALYHRVKLDNKENTDRQSSGEQKRVKSWWQSRTQIISEWIKIEPDRVHFGNFSIKTMDMLQLLVRPVKTETRNS